MARAFIASVPLAIVLVAALVVPLAVIPGTFGFESWPSSPGGQVTERQVRLAPPPVATVAVRPRRAPERTHILASAAPGGATPSATRTPATVTTTPRQVAVARVTTPVTHHGGGQRHSAAAPSAGRPAHQPAPPTQHQPQQPQHPSSEPGPSPGLVATDEPPVAREDPAAQPVAPPPPSPVQEVPAPAPVRNVEPYQAPCHGRYEGGEHGHGGHGGGHDGHGGHEQE